MSNVHGRTIGLEIDQYHENDAPNAFGGSFFKEPDAQIFPITKDFLGCDMNFRERFQNLFESRISQITTWLLQSEINRHGPRHMDTTSNIVSRLGRIFPFFDVDNIEAALQGAAMHDIGYDPGLNRAQDLRKWKGAYNDHPVIGSNMFRSTMDDTEFRPEWWTDNHTDIAANSILYHSNGGTAQYARYWLDREGKVLTWKDVLPMFTRFADKIDNTHSRVYREHMEALATDVLGLNVEGVRRRMQENTEILLSPKGVTAKRCSQAIVCEYSENEMQKVFADLAIRMPDFDHRIAPYAIIGQSLAYSRSQKTLGVIYDVDINRLCRVLHIPYTSEHHLQHFLSSLCRSMEYAAEVAYRIRTVCEGRDPNRDIPTFVVQFHYVNDDSKRSVAFYPPANER